MAKYLMELFINNKYTTIYYAIIEKAKAINRLDEYTEKHHIIPKSIGGANEASNLVRLTAREHFICHMLLPKMVPYEYRAKMTYAAWAMTMLKRPGQARYKVTASQYEAIKKQRAAMLALQVGPLHPNFGKSTGRTSEDFTPEWKAKLSASKKGKQTWNKGITHSQATRDKISTDRKAKAGMPGWNLRPPCSDEKAAKIKTSLIGKKWVNNGTERKYVSPELAEELVLQGWKYGLKC